MNVKPMGSWRSLRSAFTRSLMIALIKLLGLERAIPLLVLPVILMLFFRDSLEALFRMGVNSGERLIERIERDQLTKLLALLSINLVSSLSRKNPKIAKPPGSLLYRLVNAIFSRKKVERIFAPIIADWREEFFEELHADRIRQARLLRVKYTWAIFEACCLEQVFALIKMIFTREAAAQKTERPK